MTYHLRFDFDMVEHLSIVYSHLRVDHLRHNKHIAEMGFDYSGLVKRTTLCAISQIICRRWHKHTLQLHTSLSLAEFLDKGHGLSLKTSLHASSGTGMNIFQKFLKQKNNIKSSIRKSTL